jgi:O-antigen/teichoic acid export membrane protein
MIARHRIRAASWTYALSDALRAVLLLLPAIVTGELRYVLWGAVAFAAARVAATLVYLRRELRGTLAFDGALARTQLAYSLPFALAVVLATAQLKLHEVVVSHAFDAATYAVYAVGCLQIPFIDFVASPASDVMMVRMSEALAAGRTEEARASFFDAVSGLALVFAPLVGLLVLSAHELIVLLFTSAYAASVPVFRLWSLTILFVPLLADPALRVYAETGYLAFANLVQLVVLALLVHPMLAGFGLEGAVIATAVALLAGRVVALRRVRRRLGGGGPVLPWRELGRVLAAAALALPVGWAAKAAAGDSLPVALVAGGAAYAAAYLVVAWRWGLAPELGGLLRGAVAKLAPARAGGRR